MPPKQDEKQAGPVEPAALTAEAAKKKLGAAKGRLTKAENAFYPLLKEDAKTLRNRAQAESLLDMIQMRFDEVQDRFEDLENLIDDPESLVDERQDLMLRLVDAKTAHTCWLAEAKEPADAEDAAGRTFISSMAGMNFNVTKVIRDRFTGDDLRKYTEFAIQWEVVDNQMSALGFTNGRKLMELKKVLDGEALETIKQLPLENDNYEKALRNLEVAYKKPIKFAELVVLDLLNAQKMTKDRKSIMTTLNAIEQAEQALQGLRLSKAEAGELVFAVICESKLNNSTQREWTKKKESKKNDDKPTGHEATLEDLKEIIRLQITLADQFETKSSQDSPSKKEERKEKEKNKGTVQGSFSVQKKTGESKCLICGRTGHGATECFKITKLKSAQDRVKFLDDAKISLCRNCMKGPHHSGSCRQEAACQKCGKKHHTLLHYERSRVAAAAVDKPQSTEQPSTQKMETSSPTVAAATAQSVGLTPILQSCLAWVLGSGGEKALSRIFFDPGSEITLIRRDLAQKLGLDGPGEKLRLSAMAGIPVPPTQEKRVTFKLESLTGDFTSPPMKAVTKEKIIEPLREVKVDLSKFAHLKGLNLADEIPRGRAEVDVLIGVDLYHQLVSGPVLSGEPNQPVALTTKLGFILSGTA